MPKIKILIAGFGVLIVFLLAAAVFVRTKYVVPILMYHAVTPDLNEKDPLLTGDRTFERQMRFLKENNYNVLSLEQLSGLMREKKRLPPKTVAITLDDGLKNNFTFAFPILKKYKLPATIFLIVDEVGRKRGDKLNWDEIKLMQDSGLITFGSHTLGPEPLVNIKSRQELRRQIVDSKKILEEKLGRPVRFFSYPEGKFDGPIRQMVIDAGYIAAVATKPGKNFSNDDLFALKRIRISDKVENMFIFAVETSGFYTFMQESKRKHGKK